MRKKVEIILPVLALIFFLCATNALALTFGDNITIWDGKSQDSNWHRAGEDQEVEPGMQHGQIWDLEAFMLNGFNLTMVGGYDFQNGEGRWHSGDIFIDINNDALYGNASGNVNGNLYVNNNFNYEYAIVLDKVNWGNYSVYSLAGNDVQTITAYYKQNQGSSPWRYGSGGTLVESGTFTYLTGFGNGEIDGQYFNGGYHNALTGFDLSFIDPDTEIIAHYTMGCGNDNLMGKGTLPASQGTLPTPEPGTVILLATGLIGVARFRNKKSG